MNVFPSIIMSKYAKVKLKIVKDVEWLFGVVSVYVLGTRSFMLKTIYCIVRVSKIYIVALSPDRLVCRL